MNLKQKGLASGLLAASLMLSSFVPALANGTTIPTRLKVQPIDRVTPLSTQTVLVDVLDQNSQQIAGNTDNIALKLSNHSGLVLVTDASGNRISSDRNGNYLIPAVDGEATFHITDNTAEQLTYYFTDADTPTVRGVNTFGYFVNIAKMIYSSSPIAPTGNLTAGASADEYVTVADKYNAGISGAPVWLSLNQGITKNIGGGTATVDGTPLTDAPQEFTADRYGRVHVVYTAPDTLPSSGADTLTAQDTQVSPHMKTNDVYTYDTLSKFSLSVVNAPNGTIAKTGTLSSTDSRTVTVTAQDAHGVGVGKMTVFLSLTTTASGGGSATVDGTPVTDQPTAFTTDDNGQLTVTYQPSGTLPNGGTDTLLVQDQQQSPKIKGSIAYTYASATKFLFDPSPLQSTGKLKPSQPVNEALTVFNSLNQVMPNVEVYLTFTPAAGSDATASVNGTPLSTNAQGFFTDSYGRVTIAYTSASVLPNGGTDTITAQDTDGSTKPKLKTTATYTYAAVSRFDFFESPVAPTGTLNLGDQKTVTLTAHDNQGHLMPNATVYLSMSSSEDGGGSAAVMVDGTPQPLSTDSQPFTTDGVGQIDIVYSAPTDALPSGDVDTIVAQDAQDKAHVHVSKSVTYTYASVSSIVMNPKTTIAPTGSLGVGKTTVMFTALDSKKNPMSNTTVYLSLQSTAGATASVNGVPLTNQLQPFQTDYYGDVYVDYATPSSLPSGGTDVIKVQDRKVSPKATTTGSYTYASVGKITVDHTPIAAKGSLQASDTVDLTLTVYDTTGKNVLPNTIIYLSKKDVIGGGTFYVGDPVNTLDDTKQAFVTNAQGQIVVTYAAPSGLPASGTLDSLYVQDTAATTARVKLTDSYTF